MTTQEISAARKVQAVLLSIHLGKPVFFNVVQYEKMGLVKCHQKFSISPGSGNKEVSGYTFHLTEKSQRFLNVQL
jgi:hypothetical protein